MKKQLHLLSSQEGIKLIYTETDLSETGFFVSFRGLISYLWQSLAFTISGHIKNLF